jgi:hypothetical protein
MLKIKGKNQSEWNWQLRPEEIDGLESEEDSE